MTTLRQRQQLVSKWRKVGDSQKSYNWIAEHLGVSKPEAKRLENPDHIPGLKVQAQLKITPICPACHRTIPKKRVAVSSEPIPDHLKWWKHLSKMEQDRLIHSLYCEINQG